MVTLPGRVTFAYLGYPVKPSVTQSRCEHLYQLMPTSCILSILVYPQLHYLLAYHMGLSQVHCNYLCVGLLQEDS